MVRLLLHIGSAKTGTSSIQKFLASSRVELMRKGVCVPNAFTINKSGNSRWLHYICKGPDHVSRFLTKKKLVTKELKSQRYEAIVNRFNDECKDAVPNCNTFVVSSEHLQILDEIALDRLENLLTSYFDEICIVLYIRDPLKSAVSMLSTRIKDKGGTRVS